MKLKRPTALFWVSCVVFFFAWKAFFWEVRPHAPAAPAQPTAAATAKQPFTWEEAQGAASAPR